MHRRRPPHAAATATSGSTPRTPRRWSPRSRAFSSEASPENAATFKENAERLIAEIGALEAAIADELAPVKGQALRRLPRRLSVFRAPLRPQRRGLDHRLARGPALRQAPDRDPAKDRGARRRLRVRRAPVPAQARRRRDRGHGGPLGHARPRGRARSPPAPTPMRCCSSRSPPASRAASSREADRARRESLQQSKRGRPMGPPRITFEFEARAGRSVRLRRRLRRARDLPAADLAVELGQALGRPRRLARLGEEVEQRCRRSSRIETTLADMPGLT